VQKTLAIVLPGAVILAVLGWAMWSYLGNKEAAWRKNFIALRVNEEAKHSLERGRLEDDSLMYSSLIPKDQH
jgi:HAMP domain-containing protein